MMTTIVRMTEDSIDEEAIKLAGSILKKGGLVAFPTETVYGLGGNAYDPGASKKIYAAKGRPSDNPLIVHIAKTEDLGMIAESIPDLAWTLAERFWPGPLTMILPKKADLPKETTGGLDTVAVRFPSNKIACALIREAGGFVAAPSANLSGRPSTTKAEHVIHDMDGRIDMIIDGGECAIGLESTIIDLTEETPVILRPGYYNIQNLSEVAGEVRADKNIGLKKDLPPKAPGMKYRHYAPKAELILVAGERTHVAEKINELVGKAGREGKRPAVICSQETKDLYAGCPVYSPGSFEKEEEIAHRLFACLREIDETDADIIYSEMFDTPNIGRAIMNRLKKAAGNHIITAD